MNNEILYKLEKYLKTYSFENADELKKLGKEKFNNLDKYEIEHYDRTVYQLFLANDRPEIKLDRSYSTWKFTGKEEFLNGNIFTDYLDNKDSLIDRLAKEYIMENKEKLGFELLVYDYKKNLLNKVIDNKNNSFNDLYINKKILNSIKDIDARTLNITICYGNENFTFKYDYKVLRCDLLSNARCSSSYSLSYEKVSNFIKEHSDKKGWIVDFEFSHIESITHGRKQLYLNLDNKTVNKAKRHDRDAR